MLAYLEEYAGSQTLINQVLRQTIGSRPVDEETPQRYCEKRWWLTGEKHSAKSNSGGCHKLPPLIRDRWAAEAT